MGPNRIRRAQSKIILHRLEEAIKAWLKRRRALDTRQQYSTQLASIESLLKTIQCRLSKDFGHLDAASAPGEFYDSCARFDRRVVWLERLWRFFQAKFDQRDDSEFGPLLAAADEVVWSCYSQVFDRAKALGLAVRTTPGPAPLPFVESRYSPEAFPAELVPPDLKSEVEVGMLREHLNRMPAPVVRVPASCAASPWWLVCLGHEVGHHIQYDLLPDRKLVAGFRDSIEKAVEKKTGDTAEAQRWGGWSREIFADMFSVFCMGPWAVWAMVELEMNQPSIMSAPREDYPPPVTRLALLARAADQATESTAGSDALRGMVAAAPDGVADAVLGVALGELPGVGKTLPDLCDFDSADFSQTVPWWQDKFRRRTDETPSPHPRLARLLTASAVGAWEKIAGGLTDAQLEDARADLAGRYLDWTLKSAVEGERAGGLEADSVDSLAGRITDAMWSRTAD